MRRIVDRLRNDEQGAYMAVIGALFFTLLVVMVLAVDTGMVYQERHELQNGADAGAIAVAFNCARGDDCSPEASIAVALANSNATTDGIADVESVDIDMGAGEVTVTTRSEAEDGEPVLYLIAAPVFELFGRSVEPPTVRARATAAWGALSSAATIPWVISYCDLEEGLDDQGGYVDIPPPSGWGTIITFHDASGGDTCSGHPGFPMEGDDVLYGGFNMLKVDDKCIVQSYTDEDDNVWVPEKAGTGVPDDWRCLKQNEVMMIPIFVDFKSAPGRAYRIGGYAAFYVTGWRITGAYATSPAPCSGSTFCISGWFTEMTVSDGQLGGVDMGVRTARLTR